MKIYVGCERKEYGIKPLIIVRYELSSNTTPVATTDSVGGKRVSLVGDATRTSVGNLPSGSGVCNRREPPRLRPPHRNALAPLQYLILLKNQIVILYLFTPIYLSDNNFIYTLFI
ncbi:MAG: hypothetical protein RMZ41_026845 [Nostoc sp. DedVER02]|uniref:hypothetical protein n=1 Tax=unclassified Nostoc TaxID=2593658 RepID=UPI002AD43C3B|nr:MULTISPECIES: hypothetical protein [unclassified Nostoc]MDZ7989333.1 hypothetical protein [Nostoc sp. DedVER02]MDZ8110909.1 hypothetical protein [Nostoc sp. DedVER01b]